MAMLTATQATAVAAYLVANTPGGTGELQHSHISAWQMSCETLEALGYATETARGAVLHRTPVLPSLLPRWDDVCCVVVSVAMQANKIRLRHSRSAPTDKTGPISADSETTSLMNLLGLTSCGAWTEAATQVLWRTAPDEARPVTEEEYCAQVSRAVTEIPDAIRAQIETIYAKHPSQFLRDHLVDWVFFEAWRWDAGWVSDELGGRMLDVFHDGLAQRMRAAVVKRIVKI